MGMILAKLLQGVVDDAESQIDFINSTNNNGERTAEIAYLEALLSTKKDNADPKVTIKLLEEVISSLLQDYITNAISLIKSHLNYTYRRQINSILISNFTLYSIQTSLCHSHQPISSKLEWRKCLQANKVREVRHQKEPNYLTLSLKKSLDLSPLIFFRQKVRCRLDSLKRLSKALPKSSNRILRMKRRTFSPQWLPLLRGTSA